MIEQGADHGEVVLQAGLARQVEMPAAVALPVRCDDQEVVAVRFGLEVAVGDLLDGVRTEPVEVEHHGNVAPAVVGGRHVQLVGAGLTLEVERLR